MRPIVTYNVRRESPRNARSVPVELVKCFRQTLQIHEKNKLIGDGSRAAGG